MTLRDITFWGWFKIILFIELFFGVFLIPVLIIVYFTDPTAITVDYSQGYKFLGMITANGSSHIHTALISIPLILLGTVIKSAMFHFAAAKTPIGRIRIGRKLQDTGVSERLRFQ